MHLIAAFPYSSVVDKVNDPEQNVLRNLLMFKLFRISRLSTDFIPDDALLQYTNYFFKAEARDERIANDKMIANNIKIIKQVLTTIMLAYFMALLWYRFSDYWQNLILPNEPLDREFVILFNLKPMNYIISNDSSYAFSDATNRITQLKRSLFQSDDWDDIDDGDNRMTGLHTRLIATMYFSLTTLATVGYGDYYPSTMLERMLSSLVQLFGVSYFSVLMNNFIDVVLSMKTSNGFNNNEDNLQKWLTLVKKIKNQPFGGNLDISSKLKDRIETHFNYFWENDRTAVLYQRKEYFDGIPQKI